jgi:peptide/nickel transport system substrate-binding protein
VKKKNYGIIIMGWGPDFPTVQGYGWPLWHSKAILENGNNNFAMVDDPKIDKAFDDYSASLDEAEKTKIAGEINKMVMEGGYYLPFVFEKVLTWRSDRATNVYSSGAYSGQYDFASIGVK